MTNLENTTLCFVLERMHHDLPEGERRSAQTIGLEGAVSMRIRHNLVTTAAGARPDALVFEPLPGRTTPTVRMIVDDDEAVVRVNGESVGSTCELHVGDVVECVGGRVRLRLSMSEGRVAGLAG